MKGKSAPGLGPYSIVLVGLFVLVLLAVRTWQPAVSTPQAQQACAHAADRSRVSGLAEQAQANAIAPPSSAAKSAKDTSLIRAFATAQRPAAIADPVADRAVVVAAVNENEVPLAPEAPFAAPMVAARTRTRPNPQLYGAPLTFQRQDVNVQQTLRSGWPHPESLIWLFGDLQNDPVCGQWATEVLGKLAELEMTPSLGAPQASAILDQLQVLATSNVDVNEDQLDVKSAAARARHALVRRLNIWRQVNQIVKEEPTWRVSIDAGDVATALQEVDSILKPGSSGKAWADYLLIEHVRLIGSMRDVDSGARRTLARRVLERLDAVYLSADQRQFLQQDGFTKLGEHMRRWAYEPLDYRQLLDQIEVLESPDMGQPENELAIADDWRTLRWSPWQQTHELADELNLYYRNANVRVAVSVNMINRLLPDVQDIQEDVDDQILGTQVNGTSRTRTRLAVELFPDRLRWRFGLVARGHVDSSTAAEKGAITFFSNGNTLYRVRKLMTVDNRGVFFHRAEAIADNSSELTDVSTSFDKLPVVGSVVRSLAKRGHSERSGEADAEVEWKVGARVAQRMDDEVAQRFSEAEQRYREQILRPLRRLQLNPTAIEMQTTDERLIARYRVAADHQLAAYTPRPQAPRDSLLSIQVHDTALNNFIGQMHLDGRRLQARELIRELATAVGKTDVQIPEDLRDDVYVQFADQDAMRIVFQDGRADLTMRFAEFQAGRDTWYDFTVRTSYTPKTNGTAVQLERDGTIELIGPYISIGDKVALRVIFTAVLNRYPTLTVLDPKITSNPKMTDVSVSQFVIRDGWIGIALSPLRSARAGSGARVSASGQNRRQARIDIRPTSPRATVH